VSSSEGSDWVDSIEFIEFLDGTLTFDPAGVAAQISRLYDTVLQRAPDQPGLDHWVDQVEDQGSTLSNVAAGFLSSPEFQAMTSNLSDADFVEYLYRTALDRASDPAGKAHWTNQLATGWSRADVVLSFSESDEHVALTSDLVARGFFNTDDDYQAIAALYHGFAGRLPDASGLIHWAELLDSGALTLSEVAANFAQSSEFQNRVSGMTNFELVNTMYLTALERSPDPSGQAYYVHALDSGMGRGDLLLAFSQSVEHLGLISSRIINGIDYL
jgi:hypothetical protein